ncbi:MAG: DUF2513 domain-containing protein [Chloroflexi bacterium]|nr:DUF2513 domain-containing protein [Chloroflexota bacterium]
MKREMNLIKDLLEHVERTWRGGWINPPEIAGNSECAIMYHAGLCEQAGFLEAKVISGSEEPYKHYVLGSLTWAGHEMLETLRNR